MFKTIKKFVAVLSALGLLLIPSLVPVAVHAQSQNINDNLCSGADLKVDGTCGDPSGVDAKKKVNDLLATVINIFSLVVGIVAVIMIIIGGLKYITSGGDSGNVTGAKNTILYAIIGLVIVALAQFIVKFVLAKVNPNTP